MHLLPPAATAALRSLGRKGRTAVEGRVATDDSPSSSPESSRWSFASRKLPFGNESSRPNGAGQKSENQTLNVNHQRRAPLARPLNGFVSTIRIRYEVSNSSASGMLICPTMSSNQRLVPWYTRPSKVQYLSISAADGASSPLKENKY